MSLRLSNREFYRAGARDLVAGMLYRLGMSDPRRLDPRTLLILTFHRVLPPDLKAAYPLPGLVVTPTELRWVIERLQPYFEVLPVTHAWTALSYATPRTKPLLSVSFDDGQWDNLEFAEPVLRDLGVLGTFYIPVEVVETRELLWHDRFSFAWASSSVPQSLRESWCGRAGLDSLSQESPPLEVLERLKTLESERRLEFVNEFCEAAEVQTPAWSRVMTWDEISRLARMGHEIGSHSVTHRLLPQLDEEAQRQELANSRHVIEMRVDTGVHSICYPNGDHDTTTVRIARETGYVCAVTTRWGLNGPDAQAHALHRCDTDAARLVDRLGRLSEARLRMRLFARRTTG